MSLVKRLRNKVNKRCFLIGRSIKNYMYSISIFKTYYCKKETYLIFYIENAA